MTSVVKPKIVREWLKQGISESSLLLHGTSVEAISYLIETGVLPRSRIKTNIILLQ